MILFYGINRKGGEDIPMSNDWFYEYFINEVKAIRRNSITKPLTYDYMPEGYPSKSGWNIEWDGNPDGLVSVIINGIGLYKVSNIAPTKDELLGATLETSTGRNDTVISDMIGAMSEDIAIVAEAVIIVQKDNAAFGESLIPQKGTYFLKSDSETYTTRLSKQIITPMAEEFMSQTPIFYFTFDDSVRCQTLYNEDETLVTIEQIRAVGINAILYDTSASAYYRPVSFNSHGDSAYYYIAKGNYTPEKVFYRAGFFKGLS